MFSNIVNFSVFDFLQRAVTLCLFQSTKTESEFVASLPSVRFPTHHKQATLLSSSSTSSTPFSLTTSDIEEVVLRAFSDACDLIKPLNVNAVLHKNGYGTMMGLSNFIRKTAESVQTWSKIIPIYRATRRREVNGGFLLGLSDASFKGMRVFESIDSSKVNSYFKVSRGGGLPDVYLHKPTLSADRLNRVMQTNRNA